MAFILTSQVGEVPEQAPLQPANVDGGVGVAVSLTIVSKAKSKKQVEPQLMPVGKLVTVPLPVPALLTVKFWLLGKLNVAITFWMAFIFTSQFGDVPEQAPLHPANVEGAAGEAVNRMVVSKAKSKKQAEPQSMPAGELVMVPLPVPALLIVSL
jgi:hypothetical protein